MYIETSVNISKPGKTSDSNNLVSDLHLVRVGTWYQSFGLPLKCKINTLASNLRPYIPCLLSATYGIYNCLAAVLWEGKGTYSVTDFAGSSGIFSLTNLRGCQGNSRVQVPYLQHELQANKEKSREIKYSWQKWTLKLQSCWSARQYELSGHLFCGTSFPLCGDVHPWHSIKQKCLTLS